MIVRRLESRDIDQVVARVNERLAADALRNGLLNAGFSDQHFAAALRDAASQTWIVEESGVVVGHLFGALLDSPEYGRWRLGWSRWCLLRESRRVGRALRAGGSGMDRAPSHRTLRVGVRRPRRTRPRGTSSDLRVCTCAACSHSHLVPRASCPTAIAFAAVVRTTSSLHSSSTTCSMTLSNAARAFRSSSSTHRGPTRCRDARRSRRALLRRGVRRTGRRAVSHLRPRGATRFV